MPLPFIFNNSKFEQMLQIHVVSKKSLCLTKTKVKILDPGNIQQNKLQIQSETNQTLTMQRRFAFFLEKLKNTLKTLGLSYWVH